MKKLSLRTQVFITVGILLLGVVSATVYIADAIEGARESIVKLNRERLNSLTASVARRYGTVLDLSTAEQAEHAAQPELLKQLNAIASEEFAAAPDVETGFFHFQWNSELVYSMMAARRSTLVNARTFKQFVPPILQTTYNEEREQWTHYESPAVSFLIVTAPVYAHGRVVGAAWSFDDLGDELSTAWPQDVTLFLQFVVVVGILLAVTFVVSLRQDVNAIQNGLTKMKHDLTTRLPVSRSEMGSIAGSINELANTVLQQQREKEDLQHTILQKEKLASLGQLIAGVAHEVRTPLAGIKTRIQLWQQAKRTGKKKRRNPPKGPTPQSMRLVVEQLDRMELIVQKLLLFSKQKSPRLQSVDIHKLLDQFVEEIRPDAKKQRVRVERAYAPDDPNIPNVPNVLADPAEMRRVFQNLFKNALDAMNGRGVLRISTEASPEQQMVQIAVEDSGGGIDPEIVSKIFDPFYTTKNHGVGLGLSIAYEIVRAHNGNIWCERSSLGGARFVVSLQREAT